MTWVKWPFALKWLVGPAGAPHVDKLCAPKLSSQLTLCWSMTQEPGGEVEAAADGALPRAPRRERQGEKVRFALDSPLEGDGFELSVPRWIPQARWVRPVRLWASTL